MRSEIKNDIAAKVRLNVSAMSHLRQIRASLSHVIVQSVTWHVARRVMTRRVMARLVFRQTRASTTQLWHRTYSAVTVFFIKTDDKIKSRSIFWTRIADTMKQNVPQLPVHLFYVCCAVMACKPIGCMSNFKNLFREGRVCFLPLLRSLSCSPPFLPFLHLFPSLEYVIRKRFVAIRHVLRPQTHFFVN